MRKVTPRYDTTPCSADLIESVNLAFANQVYALYASRRYGVISCVEENFDKVLIQKELLDLNLINDPNFCITPTCIAPCGVVVSVMFFNPKTCPKPSDPSASISIPTIVCTAPGNVHAIIFYQSLN